MRIKQKEYIWNKWNGWKICPVYAWYDKTNKNGLGSNKADEECKIIDQGGTQIRCNEKLIETTVYSNRKYFKETINEKAPEIDIQAAI